jgi:hypothetical protein
MRVIFSGSSQMSPEISKILVIVEKKRGCHAVDFLTKKFPYLSFGLAGNIVGRKSVLSYSLAGSGTAVEIFRMVAHGFVNGDVVYVNVISTKQVTEFQTVFPA